MSLRSDRIHIEPYYLSHEKNTLKLVATLWQSKLFDMDTVAEGYTLQSQISTKNCEPYPLDSRVCLLLLPLILLSSKIP